MKQLLIAVMCLCFTKPGFTSEGIPGWGTSAKSPKRSHPCELLDPTLPDAYLQLSKCVKKYGLPPKQKELIEAMYSSSGKKAQDCMPHNLGAEIIRRLEMNDIVTTHKLNGIELFSSGTAQTAWEDDEHKRMAHEAHHRAQKQMEDLKKSQAIVGEVAVQKAREISAEFEACRGSKSACAPTVSDPPRRGLP